MESALFLALNLAAGAAAFALGRVWRAEEIFCFGLVTRLVAFVAVAVLSLQLAGASGTLRALPVLGWTTLAAGATRWAARKFSAEAADVAHTDDRDPWFFALGVALATAFGALLLARLLSLGTDYFSDDFGYHALAVNAWLRTGRFDWFAPSLVAYYPYNGELVAAWFALPFHHDAWVTLAGATAALLAAATGAALGSAMGQSRATSLVVAAMILCSPQVVWLARTFSAVDLMAAALSLAAVLFTARAATTPDALRGWAAGGVAAGLAAGCKITVAPMAVLLAAMSVVTGTGPLGMRARRGLVFVGAAALAGGFWYARNWLATGNPLFPAAIGPWPGPYSKAEQHATTLLATVRELGFTPRTLGRLAWAYLDWPHLLGACVLLGYGSAMWAELRRSAAETALAVNVRRALLACGLLLLALHPLAPFSFGDGIVDGQVRPHLRYVIAPAFMGMVLFARLLDARHRFAWLARALAVAAIAGSWPGSGKSAALAATLGAIVWLGVTRARRRTWMTFAAAALAVGVVIARTERMARLGDANVFATGRETPTPIGRSWAALEKLPPDSRVAVFSAWELAPYYGRKLQLQPVWVDWDGRALAPLHRSPGRRATIVGDPPAGFSISAEELRINVKASGADFVFIRWSPGYEQLRHAPEFAAVYDDGGAAILKPAR